MIRNCAKAATRSMAALLFLACGSAPAAPTAAPSAANATTDSQSAPVEVVQGGIARLQLHVPESSRAVSIGLRAFGRDWPVHRLDGERREGFVGVDLGVKPGAHPFHWRIGKRTVTGLLRVLPGHFRISRITVPRKMAVFDQEALARIHADHVALAKAARQAVNARPSFRALRVPVHGVISTPFGARRYVNGEPRAPHIGLDIAAPEGTPVLAPMAGRILMARDMLLSGNTVVLGHGDGLVTIYAHLRNLRVRPGQWLNAGERIGEVGSTGRATGPHLHWGVRFRGARINPETLLPEASFASSGKL